MLKRIMLVLVAGALAACAGALPLAEAPERDDAAGLGPPDLTRLRVAGTQIVNARGQPVVLRGVNRPGLELDETGYERFTEADIGLMAQYGANVVRLPINPVWYLDQGRPAYRRRVAEVVTWAERHGMYTLLDLHWSNPDSTAVCRPDMVQATAFWRTAAETFAGRPAVLYDIYNEPCQITWEEWAPLAEALIDAVRSAEPEGLVLVPGVDWSYDLRGVLERPIQREQVVYKAHDYPWKAYLPREAAYGFLADHYPVVLGEFGADGRVRFGFWADPEWYGREVIGYAEARGLDGWIAWAWHIHTPPNLFADWMYTPTPFGAVVLEALQAARGTGR
ncbi:MAG: cellulase family glycosylhydrolase [Chloroflexi bacterium]|nr:cellulase family glycosylhydrolase [Chloroflexota bacterium]